MAVKVTPIDMLTAEAYLVLEKSSRKGGLTIAKVTKEKPWMASGQVAVRIRLLVPRASFEALIPTVEAQLAAPDLIAPEVTVAQAPGLELE